MIFGVSRSPFRIPSTADISRRGTHSLFPAIRGNLAAMNGPDEQHQIADVVTRLEEKFPGVPTSEIEIIVAEEAAALEGNPIRDYIPRLVEHGARGRLRDSGAATA